MGSGVELRQSQPGCSSLRVPPRAAGGASTLHAPHNSLGAGRGPRDPSGQPFLLRPSEVKDPWPWPNPSPVAKLAVTCQQVLVLVDLQLHATETLGSFRVDVLHVGHLCETSVHLWAGGRL